MADEVTYGTARAPEAEGGEELSKAELQRRMEEARESISQTVAEIKDTVVNQYQSVKDSVAETLDWREQFRKRPVAWSLGSLGVGFVLGYTIGGAFKGDGSYEDDDDTLSPDDTRVFQLPPSAYDSSQYAAPRSYAAQAITGGQYGSSAASAGTASQTAQATAPTGGADASGDYAYRGGYSGGGAQETASMSTPASGGSASAEATESEPEGPGLIERFKGTKAYDRLQEEISSLGDRFIDELSKTAQTVVLPALFGKVKDLFGVDLSGGHKSGGGNGGGGGGGSRTSGGMGGGSGSTSGAAAGASVAQGSTNDTTLGGSRGDVQGGGTSSYGTSANRPYGDQGGQS